LAEGALKAAAERPWRDVTIFHIAAAAGLSVADLAPATVEDAADAVEEWLDRAAAVGVTEVDSGAIVRERLFEAAMRRFEAMEPHRAAFTAMDAAHERDPALLAVQHLRQVRAARWLLSLSGVESDGVAGAARAQGLAIILAQTRRAWRQDKDGGFSKTMATLDSALRRAEDTFGRFGGFGRARPGPAGAGGPAGRRAGSGPA
jgi:hypothetical protein